MIEGKTAIGRVTVYVLQMNDAVAVRYRDQLIRAELIDPAAVSRPQTGVHQDDNPT